MMEPTKISDFLSGYGHRAIWTEEAKESALQEWKAKRNECARNMDCVALDGSPFAGLHTDRIRGAVNDPALLKWAEAYDGRSGALLVGPTGAGKTAAASLALRLRIEHRLDLWTQANPPTFESRYLWSPPAFESMRWVSAVELGRSRSEARLGQRPDAILRAEESDLIVIDDLGWETDRQIVVEVLATRYDAGRLTIATSGLSNTALCSRYGDSVIRRILEAGGVKGRRVEAGGSSSSSGARP